MQESIHSFYYDEEVMENNRFLLLKYFDSLTDAELKAHKVPITNFTNFLSSISVSVNELTVENPKAKYVFNSFLRISPNIRMTQFFKYKTYLKQYLIFCNGEKNADVIQQMNFPDNFFYLDDEDLLSDIESRIETHGEEPYDKYETFKCVAILLWLGCSLDEIVSIKLSDVTKDSVFVPLNKKKINLSDFPNISKIFWAYRNSEGYHTYKKENLAFEMYKTDFFIRTSRESQDHKTTVFNVCRYFNQLDISKTKIIESGFVWRLYHYENKTGHKPNFNNLGLLKQFGYMNRTSAKYAYDLFLKKVNQEK